MPSEKILAQKKQVVSDLAASFKEAKTFVFVASRGLTVEQDTIMRRDLRNGNVKFQVIKNTVLRLTFKELGIEGLDEVFEGPTAVAYSDDVVAPAKIIAKYANDYEPMEIKGGIIDGKVATKEEIIALSKVPDPETLYSQVVYGLLFPFTKLAMLVKAVAEKKQEEDGAPAPAAAEEAPAAEAPAAEEAPAEEAPAAEEAVAEEAPAEEPAPADA
ncbi:MAG: 50S ribosomal protein L10 [Clostridiales bacterium]|nr:50S ribosomal protein L10 [Clostridiales bacterium]